VTRTAAQAGKLSLGLRELGADVLEMPTIRIAPPEEEDLREFAALVADAHTYGFDRTVLRSQLRAADLELGLIINFHRRRLKDGGLVRVLNPDKLEALRGSDDDHDDDHDHDDVIEGDDE